MHTILITVAACSPSVVVLVGMVTYAVRENRKYERTER